MSDDLLETLDRRHIVAQVRGECSRAGIDSEPLLDSASFYGAVSSLDVEDPGFARHVGELVREHAAARGLTPAGSPPAAAPATASQSARQWTEADVTALPKTREGARRLQEAMDAGLLTDLGYGAGGRRRGRRR